MELNKRILVVEDDEAINTLLSDIVKDSGYIPQSAYSGTEAMLYIDRDDWDLILLDLMLPGMPGEEILAGIINGKQTPVIIISAKNEQEVKIKALRMGADDFITKPFDIEEAAARIESVLRRSYQKEKVSAHILTYKDIILNADAKTVIVNSRKITLTAREFTILSTLMKRLDKIFSKANIFETVWDEPFQGDDNTVNVHMSNLRSKLAAANPNTDYIETVWGMGYKMKS